MKLYMVGRERNEVVGKDLLYLIYDLESGKQFKWTPYEVKKLMIENGITVENMELKDGELLLKNLNPMEKDCSYAKRGIKLARKYMYIIALGKIGGYIEFLASNESWFIEYGMGTVKDIAEQLGTETSDLVFYNAIKKRAGGGNYEIDIFNERTLEYEGKDNEKLNRVAYIMRSLESGDYANIDIALNGDIEIGNLHRDKTGEFRVPQGVESLKYIDYGINRLVTPQTLKKVGKEACRESDELEEVVLNYGLEEIGEAAFYESYLKKVNIPRTIKRIGKAAFASSRLNGELRIKAEEIDENAFAGTDLKEVKCIGTKVIKRGAFRENYKLREIDFGKNVTEIPYGVAYGCFNLRHAVIHKGCKVIGEKAFEGCNRLKTVYVPVETIICNGAFDKHTKVIKY